MAISQAMIGELEHELVATRKVLERLPEEKYGWAPHVKSMTAGKLASHIAEMLMWGKVTLESESFDMAPPGGEAPQAASFSTKAELMAALEKNAADFKSALARADDAAMMANWALLRGGTVVFTMPKAVCLRSMIFNHIVHHRGQLAVYLRLLNVAVPSIYGPSADEQPA